MLFVGHHSPFRGTSSRLWLGHAFADVFGIDVAPEAGKADPYLEEVGEKPADRLPR
jgi:glucuronate isomerase